MRTKGFSYQPYFVFDQHLLAHFILTPPLDYAHMQRVVVCWCDESMCVGMCVDDESMCVGVMRVCVLVWCDESMCVGVMRVCVLVCVLVMRVCVLVL